MRSASLIGLLLLVALAPVTAEANPATQRKLLRQAQKHTKAGLEHLKGGRYDQAIDQLQVAYSLAKRPIVLYHLGEAHHAKHEHAEALYYFRSYRDLDPEGAAQLHIDEVIEALASLVEGDEESGDEPDEEMSVDLASETAAEPEVEPPVAPEPAVSADGSSGLGLRIAGAIAAGSSLALLGGSAYYAKVARDRSDELSELFAGGATWERGYDGKYRQGKRASRNALLLAGAGSAALLSGAVLYYLGHRAGRTAGLEVAPAAGGGVVSWSCDF